MKYLRVLIVAVLIACLTMAAPVCAKSKTTYKNLKGLKTKTLSMTTVKVSWKKHKVDTYTIYKVIWKDGKEKHKKLKTVSGKKTSAKIKLGKNKAVGLYVKGIKKKSGKTIVYKGRVTAYSGLPRPEWSELRGYCSPTKINLPFTTEESGGLTPTGYKIYRKEAGTKEYKLVKTLKTKKQNFSWSDESVEAGKSYYYKACSYRKSGKKTDKSKMSESRLLSAINNEGLFQVQAETDDNSMTLKLTSDPLNGKTVLDRFAEIKDMGFAADQKDVCYLVESYSVDGETWIPAADSHESTVVKPGDSFWIRLAKKEDAEKYKEYIDMGWPIGTLSINCMYRGIMDAFLQINVYKDTAKCNI